MGLWKKVFGSRPSEGESEQSASQGLPDNEDLASRMRHIDLRSERGKEVAAQGEEGTGLEPETEELLRLLNEAEEWGMRNGWPVFAEYPQYGQIRAIGETINRRSGFTAMQRTSHHVRSQNHELAVSLNHFWNGVGGWSA